MRDKQTRHMGWGSSTARARVAWVLGAAVVSVGLLRFPDVAVGQESITVPPAATVAWADLVGQANRRSAAPEAPTFRAAPLVAPPPGGEIGPPQEASARRFSGVRAPAAPPPPLALPLSDSFQALGDAPDAAGFSHIPPDTHGAAGPDHLMVMLNSQVRIQDKLGTDLGTIGLDTFWAPSGTADVFDPRVVYDQGINKWLVVCVSDARAAASSMVVAVSGTADPTGLWTYYRIDADASNADWADFPDIGFNVSWIALTTNMFSIGADVFSGARMWVIDKATIGGTLTVTVFPTGFDLAAGRDGFALRPCVTFGPEPALYIVDNGGWTSGGTALLRISRITGPVAAPTWSIVPGGPFPGSGLFLVANNFNRTLIDAPQLGAAGLVSTNDARMLNAVFRNGHVWCTHSGGLPTGEADRTAVFWYQIDPGGMPTPIVQSGVVDGGTGVHHCFPSIGVNANDDVCIGFSRSDATRYVEAVYTSRLATDPIGTMAPVSVLKAGEDSYVKDFDTGNIRWGDYSATCVDPRDDLTFWTIQEYAAQDVGASPSDDRWGTWWGRKDPAPRDPIPALSRGNLAVLTALLAAAGAIALSRRRSPAICTDGGSKPTWPGSE